MPRTTSRTRRLVAGAAILAFAATACGSDGTPATTGSPSAATSTTESTSTPASGDAAVDVKDFLFAPNAIEVAVGTTVTWTNQDRFGHTATSGSASDVKDDFDIVMGLTTDKDTTGLSGSTTFDTAGTFEYFCRYHPSMVGTVTVS